MSNCVPHTKKSNTEPAANAVEDDVDSSAVRPLLDGGLELLFPVVHLDHNHDVMMRMMMILMKVKM